MAYVDSNDKCYFWWKVKTEAGKQERQIQLNTKKYFRKYFLHETSVFKIGCMHHCDGTQHAECTNVRRQFIIQEGCCGKELSCPPPCSQSWPWCWQKTRTMGPIPDTAFSGLTSWLFEKAPSACSSLMLLSSIRYLHFFVVCCETWFIAGLYSDFVF